MTTLFAVADYTTPCKFQTVCFVLSYFYVGDRLQFLSATRKAYHYFDKYFILHSFKTIGVDSGMRQCKSQSVVVTTVTRARFKLRRSSDIPRPLLHSLE
jgi:hypothetical protein